jgi:hypothetical protein
MPQALPQAPQFRALDARSRQERPHAFSPPVQEAAQVPPLQKGVGAAHPAPHVPQFAGSLARSTHAPSQRNAPSGHTQRPPTQLWLAAQTAPHAPQLRRSWSRDTHARAHAVRPALQDDAHTPRSQRGVGSAQATSQIPVAAGPGKSSACVPHATATSATIASAGATRPRLWSAIPSEAYLEGPAARHPSASSCAR